VKSYHDIVADGGSDVAGQVSDQARRVADRLSTVSNVVAVMSGKGGVGKSTVTANLAAVLAGRGLSVGILDADLNSSSIARITGVLGSEIRHSERGVSPAIADPGIKVMSVDLFLSADGVPVLWDAPTQRDAFTWRTMMEMAALREFISDTEWGSLDYLLIDLPPGTERLPNVADLVPRLAGSIVVTIPSEISQFVVQKAIAMATSLTNAPIIGIVENMASHVCGHCGHEEDLFPDGHVETMARRLDVPYLARVPFDQRMAVSADRGESFVTTCPESPAVGAFEKIADCIVSYCEASVSPIGVS
jgi:ATP-binding protein involved in chromosome partitioning